jgi:hypothetical protein
MRRSILLPTTAGTGDVLIAGMGAGDGRLQVPRFDAGVERGRLETGVAEQSLDVTNVRAALQQVDRARMPQVVGRERVRDVGALGVQVHEALDGLDPQLRGLAREKERRFVRVAEQPRPGLAEVATDRLGGAADERDERVLLAFAFPDDEDALAELDVGQIQPLALADPEADAVEELKDGAAALAARGARIGMREQATRLCLVQDRPGQPVPRLVLQVVDASRVRGRRQVCGRETARDQFVEKLVGAPPVGDAGKRAVLSRQAYSRMLEDQHQEACLPLSETQGKERRDHVGNRDPATLRSVRLE